MNEIVINQSYVGLLYENGAYAKTLSPGKHEFPKKWFDTTARHVVMVDTRERSLTIKGQEILTSDKVAIRVSLLVYYRVTDPAGATHNVSSYEDRIYEDVQLAARRFLASRTLDMILTDRNEISDAVKTDVGESAASYGAEGVNRQNKHFLSAGSPFTAVPTSLPEDRQKPRPHHLQLAQIQPPPSLQPERLRAPQNRPIASSPHSRGVQPLPRGWNTTCLSIGVLWKEIGKR